MTKMAPKATRGGRRGTTPAPTAASQRSRRGAADANLAPLNDNIDHVTRAPRTRGDAGGRARQGSAARARGGRPAAPQPAPEQQSQSAEQQQQTGTTEQVAGTGNAQTSGPQQVTGASVPGFTTQIPGRSEQSTTTTNRGQATSSAQQTATGQEEGEGKNAGGGEEGEKGKKRPSSNGSEDGDNNKKAKTGEGSGDGQSLGPGEQTQERESCVRLRESLVRLSAEFGDPAGAAKNLVRHGHLLWDDAVFSAIASVSEAVSERGAHLFALIDSVSLQECRHESVDPRQVIARAGEEMLIPWSTNNHLSLFILQRAASGQFLMRHLDSANVHSHSRHLEQHFDTVRQALVKGQWAGLGVRDEDSLPDHCTEDNVFKQERGWTCGLHTIFMAWAYALGLELSGACDRYNEFIMRGSDIVRFAIRGNVDSNTIWAFFDCHGFIRPGQVVPLDRAFDRTINLSANGELARRVERLRDADVKRRFQNAWPADLGPSFEVALAAVTEHFAGVEPDLMNMGVDEFINLFRSTQESLVRAPQTGPAATGGSEGSMNSLDREQMVGPGGTAEQRAILNDIQQSGTTAQAGETSGQIGQPSGTAGATTTTQTPGGIIDDAAAAAALQAQLDAAVDRTTAGAFNSMQNNSTSGMAQNGAGSENTQPPQGNATTTTSGPQDNAAALSTSAPTGPGTAAGDASASNSEQAPAVPATTALLNRLPREMIPGTPEYEARQRARHAEREQARQEAQRRIAAAQAMAAAPAAPMPPPPPPPPATCGQQEPSQSTDDGTGTTPGGEGEQGTRAPVLAHEAPLTEEQQTETRDVDGAPFAGGSGPQDPQSDLDSLFGGGDVDAEEDDAEWPEEFEDDDLYE